MPTADPDSTTRLLDPRRLLSRSSRGAHSSAIRDLLVHARRPGVISLAGGLPSPELFPTEALALAARSILADPANLQYGLTEGEIELREIIARQHTVTNGRLTDVDDVQIVSGSQQALDLIARITIDPGDPVVLSDPEYLGAIGAFRAAGAQLVPIQNDSEGFDVDELELRLISGLRPKLCYLIPEFHNPTGRSTSPERLTRLAILAERYSFMIVEDSPYRALRFEGSSAPSLAATTPNVVQCRTISKTIAPGLRVAWMVGPRWLLDAAKIAKQATDLHTPTLTQHLAAELMRDESAHQAGLDRLAPHYRPRRDALVAAVRKHIPEAEFTTPAGGMFLWLTMPRECDTDRLLPIALDHGVAFVPGSAFAVAADLGNSLRLSFSTASPAQLESGIKRLASSFGELP